MQIHRVIKIVSVFIVLAILHVFAANVVCAADMAEEKTIPLPSIELRSIVSEWITASGLNINNLVQQNNNLAFTALKGDIKLQITIKPYSPLASVITITYSHNNKSNQNETKKLWEHISNYSDNTEIADIRFNAALPDSVHEHISSVVCIRGTSSGKQLQFTGFVIDNKKLIIATAHDLEMGQNLTVSLHNGNIIFGTVIKIDHNKDLSLIRIMDSVNSTISLKKSRTLIDNKERVFTIGCPKNSKTETWSGLIDGSLRKINNTYLWQAQIKTLPGSSGSPAFDEYGNLIGIVKGNYRGSESIGFIITMNTIIDFLQDL